MGGGGERVAVPGVGRRGVVLLGSGVVPVVQ